jgi:hypothetical protein
MLMRGQNLAPFHIDHRTLKAQHDDARRRGDRAAAVAFDREPKIHVGPHAFKIVMNDRRPKSRNRKAGPHRRVAPEAPSRGRVVRSTAIDRGPRLNRNAVIVDRYLDRLSRELGRWQRRSARFRFGLSSRGATSVAIHAHQS